MMQSVMICILCLILLECVYVIKGKNYTCQANASCIIDCDALDQEYGCSGYIIDGSESNSLTVLCNSSKNEEYGGCQFSEIYCPDGNGSSAESSSCNIECNDYFGCNEAVIYSNNNLQFGSFDSPEVTINSNLRRWFKRNIGLWNSQRIYFLKEKNKNYNISKLSKTFKLLKVLKYCNF